MRGAWPIGMVHVLLVDCLAYLTWCMVYWWDAWPTGVACGELEGALPTGGLASMLPGPLAGYVAYWWVHGLLRGVHSLLTGCIAY